jgi:hypothetical protein
LVIALIPYQHTTNSPEMRGEKAMTKKFAKSVSFNEKNETDKAILKHIARRNFSGYVKKLILEDMKLKEEKKQKKEDAVEEVND